MTEEPQIPDNTPNQEPAELPGANLKSSFRNFIGTFWEVFKKIINIRKGTDYQGTTEQIKKDIEFQGHNLWILICSIFIASIGLNVDSTAVVIGAMLISPLMGPIVGAGYSLAVYDWGILTKSVKNLSIAAGISILTSAIYFLLTPLGEPQHELIARTNPTTLDVFIAIFGGVAGVVAGSRKERGNVIPGVAIATALMPPLCTVGYGLAKWDMHFFLGALYLFMINSIFIALSTFTFVRLLKFPLKDFVNPSTERRTKIYIGIALIIFLVPSIVALYKSVRQNIFEADAELFVKEQFEGEMIYNSSIVYDTDSVPTIELFLAGEPLEESRLVTIRKEMVNYDLEKSELIVHQPQDQYAKYAEFARETGQQMKSELLEDLLKNSITKIEDKDSTIAELQYKILELESDSVPFFSVNNEARALFSQIEKLSYADALEINERGKLDTIPTFMVTWEKSTSRTTQKKITEQMTTWLKQRIQSKQVKVITP